MNASVKGKTGLKCHNTPFSIPTTSTMQDGSYKLSYWYSINRINWQYIEQTILKADASKKEILHLLE